MHKGEKVGVLAHKAPDHTGAGEVPMAGMGPGLRREGRRERLAESSE